MMQRSGVNAGNIVDTLLEIMLTASKVERQIMENNLIRE